MSKKSKNIVVTEVEQVIATESKKLGRPVNPTSKRQQRLALMSERRAAGEVKHGRPINPNSKRQLALAAKVVAEVAAHVEAAK